MKYVTLSNILRLQNCNLSDFDVTDLQNFVSMTTGTQPIRTNTWIHFRFTNIS